MAQPEGAAMNYYAQVRQIEAVWRSATNSSAAMRAILHGDEWTDVQKIYALALLVEKGAAR